MDFFGIGPMEIILILILGLLVFGPEKLPQIGKDLGKTLRSFKKATTDLTAQVSKELEQEKKDLDGDTKQIKQDLNEVKKGIDTDTRQINQEMGKISNLAKPETANTPADGNPL